MAGLRFGACCELPKTALFQCLTATVKADVAEERLDARRVGQVLRHGSNKLLQLGTKGTRLTNSLIRLGVKGINHWAKERT